MKAPLLYSWLVAVFFGAILLDSVYARLAPEAAAASSVMADLLLYLGFLTMFAALGAIAAAWKSRPARSFFIASLAVLFLEFIIPIFFAPFIQEEPTSVLPSLLRLLISGSASILAFFGLHNFYQADH